MAKETKGTAVPANPALVEFPRDPWGFTSELRKVGLRAASSIRGNDEKHKLFLDTIRVLAQHALARLEGDAEAVARRIEEVAKQDAAIFRRQHWTAPAVPAEAPAQAEEKPAE